LEGKQRRIDLMRIQIHLGARHGRGEFAHAVRRPPARQFLGKVFGLVIGEGHLGDGVTVSRASANLQEERIADA
jgi:hypothetical protein